MKKIYLLLKNNIRNNRVTVSSTRRVDAGAGGVQLNRINAGDALRLETNWDIRSK